MPKQVDHEERRRELIDALFNVAAREGLDAVSIRSVAAEAGVPAPRVQYYFTSKAALLTGALEALGMRIVQRGMALMAAAGPDPSPEALLRAALAGAQPLDEESHRDLVLFYGFSIAALTESGGQDAALLHAQSWITEHFASLIRQAQERDEVYDGVDPEHEARLILFANTGLAFGALGGVHSVDDVVATMDYTLGKLFRPAADRPRRARRR